MDLTRKQVIEILEKADSTVYKEPKTKMAQALEYAISSLKTDEAYQIMYEGGEIFTKADMVAMLEKLNEKLKKIHKRYSAAEHWDEAYGVELSMEEVRKKINDLGGKDGRI